MNHIENVRKKEAIIFSRVLAGDLPVLGAKIFATVSRYISIIFKDISRTFFKNNSLLF